MDLRVAAYAVITADDGRMLLAHWNEGRRSAWTLPGGGMEHGEDPADTVVREVSEETGYDVEVIELLGIDSRVIAESQRLSPEAVGPLHTLRILYRARVIGGMLRNEVDGTTDEAGWFTTAQVAELDRTQLVVLAREMAGLDD